MVKHFNVIMAGLISGIVALFTSFLGISGTIIGSVISSFLYQLLSSYSQEKYEEYDERESTGSANLQIKKSGLASEVVYVFPIVVIILIELLFILTDLDYSFSKVFTFLELATQNNLFRVMGLALVVLGIYPMLGSNDTDKRNGYVLMFIGFLVFLRGIGDMTPIFYMLYDRVISVADPFFALFVVILLTFVVINILKVTFDKYGGFSKIETTAHKVETHLPNINRPSGKGSVHSNGHSKPNINRPSGKGVAPSNGYQEYDSNHHSAIHSDYENPEGFIHSDYENSGGSVHSGYENLEGSVHSGYENLEEVPVYEEDYIYIENPDDPDRPIRRKILKKVKPAIVNDSYYDDVLEESPQEKVFNTASPDLEYSSRKRSKKE